MNEYRLMLCRDKKTDQSQGYYVLFGGTENPRFMYAGWQSHAKCARLNVWIPNVFHKLSTIRLKPGGGPRDVTLGFAKKSRSKET